MERLRITYEKSGALRYTSHLDLQKIWVRALLRAKVPLGYTQGFHPTPKIAPAWPLPLGWAAKGEMIDIWADEPEDKPVDLQEFITCVNCASPQGLCITKVESIPYSAPSLTTIIQSAWYRVVLPTGSKRSELQERLEKISQQTQIERERRGKKYDLRPMIEAWQLITDADCEIGFEVQMPARDSAMGRPDELVDELGYDIFETSFTRVCYLF